MLGATPSFQVEAEYTLQIAFETENSLGRDTQQTEMIPISNAFLLLDMCEEYGWELTKKAIDIFPQE